MYEKCKGSTWGVVEKDEVDSIPYEALKANRNVHIAKRMSGTLR